MEWSKYKGVEWDEPNNKWVARWGDKHLGYFNDEKYAAKAVEIEVIKILNLTD